jgi:hypothetical protein
MSTADACGIAAAIEENKRTPDTVAFPHMDISIPPDKRRLSNCEYKESRIYGVNDAARKKVQWYFE